MVAPGPPALGRGVIVADGAEPPAPWRDAPRVVVDDAALAAPADVVESLHDAWTSRRPVVVDLRCDPGEFRTPDVVAFDQPWDLDPAATTPLDRLHHLVWANTYDARGGEPVWWWGRKAARAGASVGLVHADDGPADVVLADGRAAWVDGGPRLDRGVRPGPATDGHALVPAEAVQVVLDLDCDIASVLRPWEPVDRSADALGLAPDQHAAVTHGAGPARIIAPAGSGKTRVLTERLRHLLADHGVEPQSVLAVAYNVRARAEIEERTAGLGARAATLNALCLRVATAAAGHRLGVLTEREVRRILDGLINDAVGKRAKRTNTDPIGPYLDALTEVRLGLRDPAEVERSRPDVPGLTQVAPAYRDALARSGSLDFDEQVTAAVVALASDGELRRRLQTTHRHLLVDEFQDLTPAHVLVLRLLAGWRADVFGVGDDDQVIYGHAGADPRFLVEFDRYFPGAHHHALEVNYRCPSAVPPAVTRLLKRNKVRVAKEISAGPDAAAGDDRLRVVTHGPDAAMSCLIEEVRGWIHAGVEPADVAVLARVNSLLLAPTVALGSADLPVTSALRAEVLDRLGLRAALAWLRLGLDPGRAQSADLGEVHRRPSRGLPRWALKWLDRCSSVQDVLDAADKIDDERVSTRLVELATDWAGLAELAERGATTRQLLLHIRDVIGLGGAMETLDASKGGEGSSHLDDLEGLVQVADLHPDPAGFEPWLRAEISRHAAGRDASVDDGPAVEGITISTIHRVKGLEWDHVAVVGATDGLMPHRLSVGEAGLAEERRVFHVAVTRASTQVTVLGDETRPSPFLRELGTEPGPDDIGPRPNAPTQPPGGDRSRRARSAGAVGGRRSDVTDDAPDDLDGADAARYRALAAWRTDRARREGKAPFIVAHNRTLVAISRADPTTVDELARCHGMGPARLEHYGPDIIEVLQTVRDGE